MPRTGARRRPVGRAGRGRRFVILASQFHEPLSRALIDGAVRALHRAGAAADAIHVFWVPGAFELPVVAARLVRRTPRPDAVIALGALIKGDTPQYGYLSEATLQGLMLAGVLSGVPVTSGVVTAQSWKLARARASGRLNRGREAAEAAWEMAR